MTVTGKNRIMILGPKNDGTYVVEFRTVEDCSCRRCRANRQSPARHGPLPPDADVPRIGFRQQCATTGREQAQQTRLIRLGYSIASSALACSDGGTVKLSALAVFMLMTSWKRVGC
jgi:hypothetical protein